MYNDQPRRLPLLRRVQRAHEHPVRLRHGLAGQVHERGRLPEREVAGAGGGERPVGVPPGLGERRREEDGVQVVEDGVAGGVEGVAEGCGGVADGCDEKRGGERHWEEGEREGRGRALLFLGSNEQVCGRPNVI